MKRFPSILFCIILLSLLLVSCASTKIDSGLDSAADSVFLTELPAKFKKSRLKIIPTEDTLVAERVAWFGLYYDGKRIVADVAWESSDVSVMRLLNLQKEPGLSCIAFCLLPKKVTVSATIQSVTVKRSFTIQPANRENGLQVILPENNDFLLGSEVDFTVHYDGNDVTKAVNAYNTRHVTSVYPTHILKHKDEYNLFCLSPGETYILFIYDDKTVFRTVTVSEKKCPVSIRVPQNAVLKSGNSLNLVATYDDKDVTESADWEILYVINESNNAAVAEYTNKKGEAILKSAGVVFAQARYMGYTGFIRLDIE